MKVELSGLHRHILAIRLQAVEEVIASIRRAFNGRPEDGMLLKYIDPVPESAYPQLRAVVAKLEERLNRLADELGLPSSEHSLRRDLLGQLNICWADLGDARSQALAGYSQVPPEAAAYLDPQIMELCRLLMQAISVLTKNDEQNQG
jgi:hypothetical protein